MHGYRWLVDKRILSVAYVLGGALEVSLHVVATASLESGSALKPIR